MSQDYLQEARERIAQQRKAKEGLDPLIEFMKLAEDLPPEKRYAHRDEIPGQYLEFADWFVKRTGIEPDGRTLGDWQAELPYWSSKGLTVSDLEAAYMEASFVITRPGSLTSLAVALKSKRRTTYHKREIFHATDEPEIKAVPQPKDLYEQTRARIRAKAAQDLAGQKEHKPKPIGDVLKGMS